jgi:hypothetical protein
MGVGLHALSAAGGEHDCTRFGSDVRNSPMVG